MAEDPEFCEEMIFRILQQKVIVKTVTPQNSVKNLQEIYVNTKVNDGTDIAELMHIFTDTNAYDFEKFPKVSNRKKQFKENEGGKQEVCDLVENYARERAERTAKEAAEKAAKEATKEAAKKEATDSAKKFFQNGVNYDVVRASITTLSDAELKKIYEEVQDMGGNQDVCERQLAEKA